MIFCVDIVHTEYSHKTAFYVEVYLSGSLCMKYFLDLAHVERLIVYH